MTTSTATPSKTFHCSRCGAERELNDLNGLHLLSTGWDDSQAFCIRIADCHSQEAEDVLDWVSHCLTADDPDESINDLAPGDPLPEPASTDDGVNELRLRFAEAANHAIAAAEFIDRLNHLQRRGVIDIRFPQVEEPNPSAPGVESCPQTTLADIRFGTSSRNAFEAEKSDLHDLSDPTQWPFQAGHEQPPQVQPVGSTGNQFGHQTPYGTPLCEFGFNTEAPTPVFGAGFVRRPAVPESAESQTDLLHSNQSASSPAADLHAVKLDPLIRASLALQQAEASLVQARLAVQSAIQSAAPLIPVPELDQP
jgi:hypothetical protein